MSALRAFLARLRPYAPLALRLMIGVLFLRYGVPKLRGMGDLVKQVADWKLPHWVAPALAWGSVAGGGALILGLLTRLAALALAAASCLIIVKAKLHGPFDGGLDLPLLTLAGCVSLALSGAGRPSIDAKVMGE